ncbi:MAG: PqqD family protein [Gammaproteobacteria bacterium]|nr:PqqD family protein [Gammaproteobacteria bacterium]MDH5345835.1 PqqD family protein [Gammaproteobacteria bacterium]
MKLDTPLTIPPQVMSRPVGDETVLLNLESGIYFGLDGIGRLIWESVSAGKTLGHAVQTIVGEYEVDPARAEADVLAFASDLVDRGLLAET